MARLEGYHTTDQLPYRPGQWVLIPKGVLVMNRQHGDKPAGRTYPVKIHNLGCGQNRPVGDDRHDPSYPVKNPTVCWPGPGGYWSDVDINDVLPCPPEKIPARKKSY